MPMGFPKKMESMTASAPASGGGGAPGFPKMFPSAPPRKDSQPKPASESAGSDLASVARPAPKEPEVEEEAMALPQKSPEPAPAKPTQKGAMPSDLSAQPALRRLLAEVRSGLEETVEKEMKRVENEFGSIVHALSQQVLEARGEADRLRVEEKGLREANEEMAKKVKVLRELQERLKDV